MDTRSRAARNPPRAATTAVSALALTGLLAATGCGSDAPTRAGAAAEPKPETVAVKLLAFTPGKLTVPAGTTVTWRNDEPIGHTVTTGEPLAVDAKTGLRGGQRPDGRLDVPIATTGATASFRFADPGTYAYYCAIHQGMNALVVVT